MIHAADIQGIGSALIEILILFLLVYSLLRFLQGTRGAGMLRGLTFFMVFALLLLLVLVGTLHLYRIKFLASEGFAWILVAIIVLFQPEFRRVLIRLGEYPLVRWFIRPESSVIDEVVAASERLSRLKIGGLIAIQREVSLGAYVEGGRRLNAKVSADLLVNIFWPGSPLHDGAVVIANDQIAAAGCLFALSENVGADPALGTRHRAAVGVTEESDAVAVVVSEETGTISAAYRGRLVRDLDPKGLRALLEDALAETPMLQEPAREPEKT